MYQGLIGRYVGMQAAGVLPSELEAALRFLLAEPPSEARAQLAAWEEHIAATAESAVAAAEASVGVEGLAEASLARAQAVHMAVEGFSAQVSGTFLEPKTQKPLITLKGTKNQWGFYWGLNSDLVSILGVMAHQP